MHCVPMAIASSTNRRMTSSYCSLLHGSGGFECMQRQAGGLGLEFQQSQPHGMHRHAAMFGIDCREEAGQRDFGILSQDMQRPSAILAAAPTQ